MNEYRISEKEFSNSFNQIISEQKEDKIKGTDLINNPYINIDHYFIQEYDSRTVLFSLLYDGEK